MSNVLKALITIVNTAQTEIGIMTSGSNRANNMGKDLENVSVGDVKIKNPNNPVQLMDGVMLVFKI